jgi:hypothetical protein
LKKEAVSTIEIASFYLRTVWAENLLSNSQRIHFAFEAAPKLRAAEQGGGNTTPSPPVERAGVRLLFYYFHYYIYLSPQHQVPVCFFVMFCWGGGGRKCWLYA